MAIIISTVIFFQGLSEEAEKDYARLIKGCVKVKLQDILKRWIKDKNVLAYLSIFGNRFDIRP